MARKRKPIVAVVGRPNVGKSTLFNALAGEMISIVKDTPGITRDRIYADIAWLDKNFTLIDTGGIEPDSGDIILSQMREQAQIAIDTADVILFMVDVKQGLVDADSKVADMLRRSHKPVVLVVNKVDSFQKYMMDVYEFYNLGIGEPIPISAANRMGLGDMLDEVAKHFPEDADTEEDDEIPRIAIVGKPNVGKSSIVNKLLGGAVDGLVRHGVEEENITAAWVPGAFEIPLTAQKMAQSGKYDAVICVGAVIRGDTSHYDLVCNESAKGIAQVELATGIPVLFGVITTENIEQAIARAGSKAGNKGYDCALSAIEMVNLMKQL